MIVLLLFFIGNCFAEEAYFQRENHYVSETIIGSINNIESNIKIDDFKIYEGRRVVFFEKGLIRVNSTYHFYIIPTKNGEYSVHIDNVLVNNSGQISSKNIIFYFNVSYSNNSLNFKVSPGVYEGENPEFIVTNIKNFTQNFTFDKTDYKISPLDSVKIRINSSVGFSYYDFYGYKIPINKFGRETSFNNNTDENKSFNCLKIEIPNIYTHQINKTQNFSLFIQNLCPIELENISIYSDNEETIFTNNNFSIMKNQKIIINFTSLKTKIGESEEVFFIIFNQSIINNASIKILSFENQTNFDAFNNKYDNAEPDKCEDIGGNFCDVNQQCSTDNYFYDIHAKEICCLSECLNINQKETNWLNVFMAILGFITIGLILYLLWKRSKHFKSQKVEDKFKEAERNMNKNSRVLKN